MRKIKLHYYSTPDKSATYQKNKMFRFNLGNKVAITLKNESKLLLIISKINEDLNVYLADLNHMYMELFNLHRRKWFVLDEENHNLEEDKMIRDSLNSIDRFMDLVVNNTNYPDANYFTFKHLNIILDEFEKIIKTFITIDKRRNNYQEIQSLKAIKKRVNSIRKEMNSLGSDY